MLCDVQTPQESSLAYLLGYYQTKKLERQAKMFPLLKRMVASDALFVYFMGETDLVLFVDTEDILEKNKEYIKYSVYALTTSTSHHVK